jgi:hypothetical protein
MSACRAAAADAPPVQQAVLSREFAVWRWNRVACRLDDADGQRDDEARVRHRLTLVGAAQAEATASRTRATAATAAVGKDPRAAAEQEMADAVAVAAASAALLAFVDPEHAATYHAAWRADRAAAAAAGLRASVFADAEARAWRGVEAVLARNGLRANGTVPPGLG